MRRRVLIALLFGAIPLAVAAQSPAPAADARIAAQLKGRPMPYAASGALQFFIERLVNADYHAERL